MIHTSFSRGLALGTIGLLRITFIATLIIIFSIHTPISYATTGINAQIPFYGSLRDSEGEPISGTVDMVFRIYDAPTDGNVLWVGTYTQNNSTPVSVIDGLFQVMLGSGSGNEFQINFNDDSYYLGITIGTDPEMTPREHLGATGYAINTNYFDGMDSDVFIRTDHGGLVEAASDSTLLALNQTGIGNLFSVANSSTEHFTILNNGNVGIGTMSPSSKLTVEGNAAFGSLETFEDVLNVLAGSLEVQSGDRSSFGGDVYVADGSGILFGGDEDGISISQDVSAYGENNLIFNLRGSAQDHNQVNFVSPGELQLVANADLVTPGDGGYPKLSMNSYGGMSLINTSYGAPEDRFLSVDFTSGMRINEGNLTLENGSIGIGLGNPTARLDVDGLIRSTELSGGGSISADADGNIILDPSDANLKQNVREIDDALDMVLRLRGVRYEWQDSERFGTQTEVGFIAQELQTVIPEVVREGGEYLTVNTKNIVAVVVEALQELHADIEEYFARTDRLEEEVLLLKSEIAELRMANDHAPDEVNESDNTSAPVVTDGVESVVQSDSVVVTSETESVSEDHSPVSENEDLHEEITPIHDEPIQ